MLRTFRQQELIDIWVQHKCRGTLVCPCGFGKTNTGIIAIERFLAKNPTKKVIVVVPSDAIKVQWMQELAKRNLEAEVRTYYDVSRHKYECSLLVLDKESCRV